MPGRKRPHRPVDELADGENLEGGIDEWGDVFDNVHEGENSKAPAEAANPEPGPETAAGAAASKAGAALDGVYDLSDDFSDLPGEGALAEEVTTGVFDVELPTPSPNAPQYEAELEVIDELSPKHEPRPDPLALVDPDVEAQLDTDGPGRKAVVDEAFHESIVSAPFDDDDMPEIEIQSAPPEPTEDDAVVAPRFTRNIIRRVPEPAAEADLDDEQLRAVESHDAAPRPEARAEPTAQPEVLEPLDIPVAKDEPIPDAEVRRVALGVAASGFALPDAVESGAGEDQGAAWRLSLLEGELAAAADVTDTRHVARVRLQAAQAARDVGDLDKSLRHLKAVVDADADYLPGQRMLRRHLIEQGNVDDALVALWREIALSSEKERAGLTRLRAEYLVLAGRLDEARAVYEEILAMRPDDPRCQLALIELTYADVEADDRLARLSKQLESATSITYDSGFSRSLATLRARLLEVGGDDDEARSAFESVRKGWPDDKSALLPLLRLSSRADRQAGAAHMTELLAHASGALSLAAGRWQAMAHADADDVESGVSMLQPLFGGSEVTADAVFLATTCDLFLRSDRHDVAASTALAWANSEVVPSRVAQAFRTAAGVQSGPLLKPAEAAASLRRALDADPGDTAAARELERAYLAAQDWDAAILLNQTTAEYYPQGSAYERARAGFLLAQTDRMEEALPELEKALGVLESAQDPASLLLRETLAGLLGGVSRTPQAAQLYRQGAESAHQWRDPAFARLRAAHTVESISDEAEPLDPGAIYASALGDETGPLVARAAVRALARLAEVAQDRQSLSVHLEAAQAASADPDRVAEFAVQRAYMSLRAQDVESAEKIAVQVLASRPQEPRITQLLVAIYAQAGRFDDVAQVLSDRADALDDAAQASALRYRAAAAMLVSGRQIERAIELLETVATDQSTFDGANALLESAVRRAADERDVRPGASPPRDTTSLIRTAENMTSRGQPAQAVDLFRQAADDRAQDPLLRDGFERAATLANDHAVLAELALTDLKAAEASDDRIAKRAAYELLARVDADLRGDAASATFAWRSVVGLQPRHGIALRALEKQYAEENRREDLIGAYEQLEATMTDSSEVVAFALARAKLCDLMEKPRDALKAYQGAYRASPQCRLALFHLEAKARQGSAKKGVASLTDAIAAYFTGDDRAQAAFLTRAGEALADAGRLNEAIDRFRRAVQVVAGYVPALRAWRDVALREHRWEDAIEAAKAEASATSHPDVEANLYLLAASVAMDHLNDAPRATDYLQRALALDANNAEAFHRLQSLLEAHQDDEALARAMQQRIEATQEQAALPALHLELAALCQERLQDSARAKRHLTIVLQLLPNHREALSMLAEIEAASSRWPEASQALIALAKLETDPDRIKSVFFRLGQIYTDHLPNPNWARKSFERVLAIDPNDADALDYLSRIAAQQGDHRTALGAANRLVTTAKDDATRIRFLHRIAKIYEEGMEDAKRAEAAYRKAMEVDGLREDAALALSDFYRRTKDMPSLRVHLDRVAGQLRTRLASDLFDGVTYRVLSRTLMGRAEAGVVGADHGAQNAAELAVHLEQGKDAERALASSAQNNVPAVPGLGEFTIDEQLFHPSIPNALRPMFRLLQGTLAKRFPPNLRNYGVGRGERLPKNHPLRAVCQELAVVLGVSAPEIYVSSTRPIVLATEETNPISIVVGQKLLNASTPAQQRFLMGRVLKLSCSHLSVAARLNHDELTLFLSAVLRHLNPSFFPLGIDEAELSAEQNKISRLIAKRSREELVPFATEIAGADFDPKGIWLGVQNTGNRAGLLCSGSLMASLEMVVRLSGKTDLQSASGDPAVAELVQFAMSDQHCELRKILRQGS